MAFTIGFHEPELGARLFAPLQRSFRQVFLPGLAIFHTYYDNDIQRLKLTMTQIVDGTMSDEAKAQAVRARTLSLNHRGQRRSERILKARGDKYVKKE